MRLILILTLLLLTPMIVSAQQTPQADQTQSYKRVPLQAEGYPTELRDTACLMGERKDVQIVNARFTGNPPRLRMSAGWPSPTTVEHGTLVLFPGPDGDYLFRREVRSWKLITKFRGKWEAPGILLEMGPCRIKTFE